MLEGNIGLVDLALLEPGRLPALFEAQGHPGIVFDLRNYRAGAWRALAPYTRRERARDRSPSGRLRSWAGCWMDEEHEPGLLSAPSEVSRTHRHAD